MTRSGSYDFSVAGDAILRGAIRLVKGCGGTAPSGAKTGQAELTETREALNMMLREWQAQGVGLWLKKELYIFLAYQTGSYSLGPSGDEATLSMIETELSSSSATSDKTLTVDSITGITDGDVIGIELDADTLQWTTVDGTPATSVVTITTGVTSGAGINNNVYTYTTLAQRPLEILEARLFRDDESETPLNILTRQEWMDYANKTSDGLPNSIYYDPQLDSGILHVWPRPEKVNDYIKATVKYPIQDIDAALNDPDFPAELHRSVKFNLAVDISHEYQGVDEKRYYTLRKMADKLYATISAFDAEYGSIIFEAYE
jgi:hypothetical protein